MKKLLLALMLLATPAFATTRYVDNTLPGTCSNGSTNYDPTGTGSCGGSGSFTVYNNIANGLTATVAGDTLYIRAGTFSGGIGPSNIPFGTSWANAPLISAYTGETVTFNNASFNLAASTIKYIIFQNLIINNGGTSNEAVSIGSGANHVRFTGCEITGSSKQGIANFHQNESGNEIINCNIHHNGVTAGLDHGIYFGSDNMLIERCEIHHNASQGIQQYNGYNALGETSNNAIVRNNKIYSNGTAGFGPGGQPAGLLIGYGNNNVAYNNLVYNNTGGGIALLSGNNNRAYNNTVTGQTGDAYAMQSSGSSIIRNNILYNNQRNVIIDRDGSAATISNILCNVGQTESYCSVKANPSFVNAGTFDFHLQAGSLAINAGCSTSGCGTELTAVFTTDFDGVARNAVPWDVGAYEYDTSGGTPSMTISSPTSGAQWNVGTQQTISWSCPVGCAGPIDIHIDRANAGTFTESIIQDYPLASGSSYTWTVTGSGTDNQVKIRVRDNDGTPTATTANFTIQASGGGSGNPIISNNTTGTKIGTISGVSDTWIWQLSQAQNNDSDAGLYVNKYDSAGHRHQLLKFDGLSQVPSGSTISSATLGIYVTGGSNGTGTADAISQTWDVRRLLRNWDKTAATWANYNATTAWATAGGLGAGTDRVAATSAQITQVTIPAVGGQYFTVTSTSTSAGTLLDDVIKIVNGTNPNYGWHIERNGAGNDTATRNGISSEGANDQRPYLELVLTTAAPTIVVTEPKAGDLFLSGQQGPVRWTSQGISGNVNIDLSRDGGTTWETLDTVLFNAADVTVTYNAPTSSNCKIRVVTSDSTVTGTSSAFRIGGTRAGFTIAP